MTLSLDAYQIDIANRIAATGGIFASGYGGNSTAVGSAILANGNVLDPGVTNFGIQMFANGLSTRTRGAELVLSFPTTLTGGDRIDWSATASYNTTTLTDINPTPTQLGNQALYGPGALSDITTASPKYKAILAATYTHGALSLTLRESFFGPSTEYEQGDDGNFYPSTVTAAALTDITVAYRFADRLTLSVGATNVFNTRPNSYNPALVANYVANLDAQAVLHSPGFAPFSINGAYYFVRANFAF
jgi:iron complex outermembrane receptor protein